MFDGWYVLLGMVFLISIIGRMSEQVKKRADRCSSVVVYR
jgi:hypothetical protein